MICKCGHDNYMHSERYKWCLVNDCKCEKFEADNTLDASISNDEVENEERAKIGSKDNRVVHCDIATRQAPNSTYKHPEVHSQEEPKPIDSHLEGSKIGSSPDTFQSLIAKSQILSEEASEYRFDVSNRAFHQFQRESYKKAQKIVEDAIDKIMGLSPLSRDLKKELGI